MFLKLLRGQKSSTRSLATVWQAAAGWTGVFYLPILWLFVARALSWSCLYALNLVCLQSLSTLAAYRVLTTDNMTFYLNCTENDCTWSVKCRIARSITAASHFEVTETSRVRVGRIVNFVSLISSSWYFLLVAVLEYCRGSCFIYELAIVVVWNSLPWIEATKFLTHTQKRKIPI